MLAMSRTTLRHHLETRPLCLKRDKSEVPSQLVALSLEAACPHAKKPGPHRFPESEALEFYFTNHVVGLIRARRAMDEILKPGEVDFLDMYHRINNRNLLNAFHYVTLIIHREMRHFSGPLTGLVLPGSIHDYLDEIRNEGGEVEASKRFGKNPPSCSFGELVTAITQVYNHGYWASSSYGGKAWGSVANALRLFVNGSYTGEMFLDTVWTLCHNNGPIFNKGMVYKNHTSVLLRILDFQAAGKIPQMLNSPGDHGIQTLIGLDLNAALELGRELFPKQLDGLVPHVPKVKKKKVGPLPVNPSEMIPDAYSIPGLIVKKKEVRDGKK